MTFHDGSRVPVPPAILPPQLQQAVWFMGALVRIRAGGDATGGQLAILEHRCERGFSTPLHRHDAEETFFVLDGELRIEVDGHAQAAGAGAVAFLPRKLPHGFVVTSPEAHYLTLHTPAGFDRFTLEVGTPAANDEAGRPDDLSAGPSPAELARIAAAHGIEILGPPLTV
ncbi:cupin domain-containing protein [Flindersiella endophytica]